MTSKTILRGHGYMFLASDPLPFQSSIAKVAPSFHGPGLQKSLSLSVYLFLTSLCNENFVPKTCDSGGNMSKDKHVYLMEVRTEF
jgi:hypothetical protein